MATKKTGTTEGVATETPAKVPRKRAVKTAKPAEEKVTVSAKRRKEEKAALVESQKAENEVPEAAIDPAVSAEEAARAKILNLRRVTRFLYDIQKLRIQSGNRNTSDTVALQNRDLEFLTATSQGLRDIETKASNELKRMLRGIPIYDEFLKDVTGCGHTMSSILISYFDPYKAPKPSSFWNYAGLAVDTETGRAKTLKAGEKANYNPFLKSKVLKVLGESFIKSRSPWTRWYYGYKHRKENERHAVCRGCEGTGRYKASKKEIRQAEIEGVKPESGKCSNCNGTGGPAPWGRSQKHRHQAAIRYMVKEFLFVFWREWRTLENLEVRPSYAEEILGRKHDSGYLLPSERSPYDDGVIMPSEVLPEDEATLH